MNLFEEDFKRVAAFEDSVMSFKKAGRNMQYLFNLLRSKVKYGGFSYHEEVEPIFRLIETFNASADHLYHLRNITPLRPLKKAISEFKGRFIASSISDDDIKPIYTSDQQIFSMFLAIVVDLRQTIKLLDEAGLRDTADFRESLQNILLVIKEEYAFSA